MDNTIKRGAKVNCIGVMSSFGKYSCVVYFDDMCGSIVKTCDIVAIPDPTIPAAGFGHASDCAMNNAPALPTGACDCGFENDRPNYDELVEALRKIQDDKLSHIELNELLDRLK